MIERPIKANYLDNRARTKALNALPCVICGKTVDRVRYQVRLVNGGNSIAFDDEEIDDDMGWYPIGMNCLQKHKELIPYAVKV